MILDALKDGSADSAYNRPINNGSEEFFIEQYGSVEGWIAQNLRFIASRWNTPYNGFSYVNSTQAGTNGNMGFPNPVNDIIQNYRYYLGIQNEVPFAYLAEISEGNEMPAPYTKGDEIYTTVQHMLGQFIKLFNSTKSTVESLDPSVISDKEQVIMGIRLKQAMPEIFRMLERAGAHYVPEARFGSENGNLENAIKEAGRRPTHAIERYGLDIIRHIEDTNQVKVYMPERFKDVVIGRKCAIHITHRSGRIFFEPIKPFYLIYDTVLDDPHNKYSTYKGFMWQGTAEEVIHRYDLDEDEIKVVRDISQGDNVSQYAFINDLPLFMGNNNFTWIDPDNLLGNRRITCITGYWIVSLKEGDRYRNTLYKGTIIGGCILKDYGPAENVVFDKADPEWPLSPIVVYSPDTTLGIDRSPVDRFRKIQDDLDAYLLQIRKVVSRDLGKVYAFIGDNMEGSKSIRELVEDFKNYGITVVTKSTGEEAVTGNDRVVETIDMSLDPNVMRYMELYKEREVKMKAIVSQTNITMGMQSTYVGGGTQRASIEQASNGTLTFYHGMIQFYVDVLDQSLGMAKTMLLDVENEEEAGIVFDGAAKQFWKAMKGVQIDAVQARVDVEDVIDDAMRAKFDTIAMSLAQNFDKTGFSMLDYMQLQKARTVTELMSYFEEKLQKIEDEKAKAKIQEMMMQAAEAEKNRQMQMAMQQQKDSESLKRETVRQFPKMEEANTYRKEVDHDIQQAQQEQTV